MLLWMTKFLQAVLQQAVQSVRNDTDKKRFTTKVVIQKWRLLTLDPYPLWEKILMVRENVNQVMSTLKCKLLQRQRVVFTIPDINSKDSD